MPSPATTLTARQQQVAQLVGQGRSYAEIGYELGMAPETARVHVKAIANKLPDIGLPAKTRVMRWVLDAA